MMDIVINGQNLSVEKNYTILQACEMLGIEIPRFCYHERLQIAGNCRMCLVEVEGVPKPVASCAMPVANKMIIHTNSAMVEKARKGVLEFLLINHPLDCPICDEGGECDLQDQTLAYGSANSRFQEYKRSYPPKSFGPLISTYLNRCIHCTRCIRFLSEVAGVEELGAFHRGEDMEISTYLEKSITSKVSGNIIDLCPVGALTSKPYAFKARPWELRKTESIDVLDGVGSAIRIDSRGKVVMRILPRINEEINEEWISDKTRFAYDGLQIQRLDKPYLKKDGKLIAVSWEEALRFLCRNIKTSKKILAISGPFADCETMFLLKQLLGRLKNEDIKDNLISDYAFSQQRFQYLFNTSIKKIEQADVCILVGTNPEIEAPIINLRLIRSVQNGGKILNIGPQQKELNYPVIELGDTVEVLQKLINDELEVCQILQKAHRPAIIIGETIFTHVDSEKILALILTLCQKYSFIKEDWNGYNVLHKSASSVGSLDLGFYNETHPNLESLISDNEFIYLLGADEIKPEILANKFVVYQGHHGDKGAALADVILPGAAYTEKNALYVNTEGRVQEAYRAVFPPGEAKEDWQIINLLANYLEINLDVQEREDILKQLRQVGEQFVHIGHLINNPVDLKLVKEGPRDINKELPITFKPFNFYMADVISRSSKTMAECSKQLLIQGNPSLN